MAGTGKDCGDDLKCTYSVLEHQASLVAQWVKNLPSMQETQETGVRSLDQEDPLEKGIATHSMDRRAWRTTVHGVTKESDVTEQLKNNKILEHHPTFVVDTALPSHTHISLP